MSAERAAPNPLRKRDARRFLRDYWQRKPLLVRGAVPGIESLLSADELAGLALEPEIESRIVLARGGRIPWELRNGPFSEKDFAELPDSHWSLLVQAVDQWVPQVHALRERFAFLPAWRFDDIMISYTSDKGCVGPHFDHYDVFLIQASGRRRWRIGGACDQRTPCRSDTELRILSHFETREEYLLEPGDMLYIPSAIAHWGVAEGECMTWSVGFRAPSHAEIIGEIATAAAARSADELRYTDAGMKPVPDGEIPEQAVRQLQRVLRGVADDADLVREWFGRFMTERKYPEPDAQATRVRGDLRAWLRADGILQRNPAARFAWTAAPYCTLYVDGDRWPCEQRLARLLCGPMALDGASLLPLLRGKPARTLLDALTARGALYRQRRRG